MARKATKQTKTETETKTETSHLEQFYQRRNDEATMAFKITGKPPGLLVHAWSKKSLIEIIAKQTGHSFSKSDVDLIQDYEEAFYRNHNDDYVVPLRVIKRVIIEGAKAVKSKSIVTGVDIGRYVRVCGHTAVIQGTPQMDVRMVQVGSGMRAVPMIRARPLFPEWSIKFAVRFNITKLPAEGLVAALEEAGDSVGLFEWRPSAKNPGEFGCFTVESCPKEEVLDIIQACASPEKLVDIPTSLLRAANAAIREGASMGPTAERAIEGITASLPLFRSDEC